MNRFRFSIRGIAFFLLTASPVWAQVPDRNAKPELPKFNLSGTVESIDLSRVKLKTDADVEWVLMAKRDMKVELTGKAKPAGLAPGQYVEFLASIDVTRGTTSEKIERMTVFTPDKSRAPGIVPDLGFGDQERATLKKKREDAASAAKDNPPAAAEAASSGDKKYAPGGGESSKPPAKKLLGAKIESFAVHGRIAGIDKKGKLTVQIPENPYTKTMLLVEVDDAADITVELTGLAALALVQPGDHIQASGQQIGEGMGMADHVTMRLEHVIGETPPKKTAKAAPEQKKPSPSRKTEAKK
jgi:hypothetical protein